MYTIIIICHFIGDWILQPREVAKSKKTSFKLLSRHIGYNVAPYLFIIMLAMQYNNIQFDYISFYTVNLMSHALIDWFLPSGNSERAMINWTAVDQILHLTILFQTYNYFTLLIQ